MLRFFAAVLAACLLAGGIATPAWCQSVTGGLVTEQSALRLGLVRAWTSQAEVDRQLGQIRGMVLSDGALVMQTDQDIVCAIDSETGQRLWTSRLVHPAYISTIEPASGRVQIQTRTNGSDFLAISPALNSRYVAATNRTTLFLLNLADGALVWSRRLSSSPSAGLAMGPKFVYVPMLNGSIEAYRLEPANAAEEAPVLYYGSGYATTAPLLVNKRIAWGSTNGSLYVDDLEGSSKRMQFRTGKQVLAAPAMLNALVFCGSTDGYVYALYDTTGSLAWQYSAGSPVKHRPVVVGTSVYVLPDGSGIAKVNAVTGAEEWVATDSTLFVAASPSRIYTADRYGNLLVHDATTGGRLGTLATNGFSLRFTNTINDRIYLGSTGGTLQCLREAQLATPVPLVPPPAPAAPAATPTPPAEM